MILSLGRALAPKLFLRSVRSRPDTRAFFAIAGREFCNLAQNATISQVQSNGNETFDDSSKKRVIEETVEFPCSFTIKVIGINDSGFVADSVKTLCSELSFSPEAVKVAVKETTGGKYVSATLVADYQKADEVYAAYAALGRDPRVKFLL